MGYIIGAILIILVGVVGFTFRAKATYYRKIFNEEHYRQIAEWIVAVLQRGAIEGPSVENGTALITDAEIVVGFSRQIDSESDVLHFSVSQRQGYTTHAVGSQILFLVILLLNQNKSSADCAYSKSTVHHLVLQKEAGQEWIVNPIEETLATMKAHRSSPLQFRELEPQELEGPH